MTPSATSNQPAWQADSTHPALMPTFREKMRGVVDPEIGLDIIQLGLIRDLKIGEAKADLRMILTTPFCPYGPAMIEMTRHQAQMALAMPVDVELSMEMWDFSMMEEGAGGDWGMY